MERGLNTYTARGDGGRVTVVCDPDRVYNPVKAYGNIVVDMPRHRDAARVVFLSSTGAQAAFELANGIAVQLEAEAESWQRLTEMMASGGQIGVVTAEDSFILDMEPLRQLRCS